MSKGAHPPEAELALYAGRDLHSWTRWRVGRHVSGCPACRALVESFHFSGDELRLHAKTVPADVAWPALAAEMKANIRVGLAAAECLAKFSQADRPVTWRAAAVTASLAAVVVTGYWLNLPRPNTESLAQTEPPGVFLEATPAGIELKENGRAMTLMHPAAARATYTVNVQGSLRARYVDAATGQVTIAHVYAE